MPDERHLLCSLEHNLAYNPLPIEVVRLEDLSLDLDNYRIPMSQPDEPATMEHLFVAEDVLSLLKLILRNGYFDNEIPVVTAELAGSGQKPYIVLEGNRRVSALKALSDPSSVPNHAKEVRSLLNRYAEEAKNLPSSIRVLVAETREVAEPHIARLHTGLSKKGWTPDQQAKFYYSRLSKTVSFDDLKAMYPGIQIARYLRMASMRQFVSGARFSDQSLRTYAAGSELKMSTLEYAYRNAEIADAIGARFTKTGLLVPEAKGPYQIGADLHGQELAALEYLITEFRAERLNTRSDELKKGAQFKDDREALVRAMTASSSLRGQPPTGSGSIPNPGSASGGPRAGSGEGPLGGSGGPIRGGGTGLPPTPGNGERSRGPNRPNTKKCLDFAGVVYDSVHVNLKHRYYELERIDVFSFPMAASILMRSVLEATIKAHFEPTKVVATGMLGECFKAVRDNYGSDRAFKSTVAKVGSGNAQTPGTLLWFNEPAHNADTTVAGADVHEAWRVVSPILRRLLQPAPAGL